MQVGDAKDNNMRTTHIVDSMNCYKEGGVF